jgi:hypothetical protein
MTHATAGTRTVCVLLLAFSAAHAQDGAVVSGIVTDPSNALVPHATVVFHETGRNVADRIVVTTSTGGYRFTGTPGVPFEIFVTAQGFAAFDSGPMQFQGDHPITLNIRLKIEQASQQIDVSDDNAMDTDPNHNGDSLTLKGKAIDDLPLDSAQLMQELEGLAGSPSPDLYVDGFSGGQLPPRDTIREIRINQNPYSAQNDTNPSNGMIQIFTKPGSNKFHGEFYTFANDSSFNTRNPFVASQPPYYAVYTFGNFNGPIDKRTSFFLNGGSSTQQTNGIVNAQTLDANGNQINLIQSVSTPSDSYNFSTRLDTAIGKKSTLIVRYAIAQATQTNGGIGQLALPSQGYNNYSTNQNLQISNSQLLSAKIVNDTRFQYGRSRVRQMPDNTAPTINVAGAFTGGGNNGGEYNDNQDRYELQNYVSASAGKQFLTFGGRFRATRDANHSRANFNGSFTFATLASYQATVQGVPGAGPSQFAITEGNPNVAVTVADTALFVQDDWKARPNLTVSGGLRFETQNHIADQADWAPRFGFAWGLKSRKDKAPRLMLRGGAGLFYSRFTSGYVLQAARQNGIAEQEYVLANPAGYPALPSTATLAQAPSAIFQISPVFHAPYFFSSTVSVERQIKTYGSVTISYLTNRGVHSLLERNINAPLPGTYNPAVPTSGVRPLGGNQNIYEYESAGVYRSNRLTANFNLHFKDRIFLFGFYTFRSDTSDANGGSFVSNPYDIGADEGRAPSDVRHQANLGGSARLPYGFHADTFVRVASGTPFNITVGQDLNGDSIFNDRPAFATDLTRPSVVLTRFGTFDTSPMAGQTIIPINYATGPGLCVVNLDLGRTFTFGPEIKPPANAPSPKLAPGQKAQINRRYSIDVGINAENVFNQVNLSPPIGTLNSPLFGRSIALVSGIGSPSANRLIGLDAYFRF